MSKGLAIALLVAACATDPSSSDPAADATADATDVAAPDDAVDSTSDDAPNDDATATLPDPRALGPYAIGVTTDTWTDPARDRALTVEIWYPSVATQQPPDTILGFVTDAQRAAFEAAVAESACTTTETRAVRNADPLDLGPQPSVVFSHCHTCTRFSSYTLAEQLASHGFVVAAVDHAGNTWFDAQAGEAFGVDEAGLATRAADLRFALDVLTGVETSIQLNSIATGALTLVDATRLGAFGHSFGSVTTGRVLGEDERLLAGVGIAAPIDSPILNGLAMDELDDPLLYVLAQEDNSITEFGNQLIRDNQAAAPERVSLLEVPDAGHWSFSNLAGLEGFEPGCGDDNRQTNRAPFTYLPLADGLDIASDAVTTFFALHLGDATLAAGAQQALDVWIASSPDTWTTP